VRDPLRFFTHTAARYGDIAFLRSSPVDLYLINHPDLVRYVLQEHSRNYHKSLFYDNLRPVLGNGLLTSDGERWLRQRRCRVGGSPQYWTGWYASMGGRR